MYRALLAAGLLVLTGFGCSPSDITTPTVDLSGTAYEDINVDYSFELARHQTFFSTSPDGITWTDLGDPIAKSASVPDIIELTSATEHFEEGTLLTYFVDGTEDHDTNRAPRLIYSTDKGQTWSNRIETTITDMPSTHVAVDPSLVQTEDGTLRMYYFDFGRNPANPNYKTYQFHSATSSDGINFTYEGVVFESENTITDPDVVVTHKGPILFFADHTTGSIALSSGISETNFVGSAPIDATGIPGAVVEPAQVAVYSCGNGHITRQTIGIDGTTSEPLNVIKETLQGVICDPSVIILEDDTYAAVVKQFAIQ